MTVAAKALTKLPPSGIGGWLLLALLSLVLTPTGEISVLLLARSDLSNLGQLDPVQVFWVLAGLGVHVLSGVIAPIHVLVLMLGRRRDFPKWYIGWLLVRLLLFFGTPIVGYLLFADLFLSETVPLIFRTTAASILGTLISSFLWISYMLNSARVRNTFVN